MSNKKLTLCILIWLTLHALAWSAIHNDISIQYINNPVNTIPENASSGTPLAYISSTNGGPFSITDTNFYIDNYFIDQQLQYRLNASETYHIDYESDQSHTYTLTVSDSAGYSNVVLHIGDVNESPQIQPQAINLTENTANGTSVDQVIANDPDTYTGYNNLTYDIIGGTGSNALTIIASSGVIRVKDKTYLDYETYQDLYLTVSVSDGKFDDITTISVNLININDNPPQINNQTFTVGNGVPPNTLVSTVYATDPDGDALSYAMIDGDIDAFTMNAATGKMTVKDSDQIVSGSLFVTVAVSDTGYTQTARIRVDVNSLNYKPVINAIADHTGTVNTARQIPFHIADTNGETLRVSVTSSAPAIVPNLDTNIQIDASATPFEEIVYEGSKDLTLTLLPLSNTGSSTIFIQVSDDTLTDHTSFVFNVLPNTPPVISDIPQQAFDINSGTFIMSFTVTDAIGETLTLSVSSDNQAVVPDAQIIIDNNGQSTSFMAGDTPRQVSLSITPLIMGAANITISAIDGGGLSDSQNFELRISTSPKISGIANTQTTEDILSNAISFTVLTQEPGNLAISVIPKNTDLIPSDAGHITICHDGGCIAGPTRAINPVMNAQETIQLFLLNRQDQYGQLDVIVCVTNEYGLTQTTLFAMTIKAQNDPPAFLSLGPPGMYTEQSMPAQIISSPVIQDVDDTHLESAQIVISQNFHNNDILFFKSNDHISGLYTPETQTLQLTGMDTIAAYQTALESITYSNSSDNLNPLPRIFSITLNDGTTDSATTTHSLTITAINDPPTITATTRTITSTESLATVIAPDILVSDLDSASLANATISIVDGYLSTEDQLLFTETQSITKTFQTATGTLSLSGVATLAQYQNALKLVKYQNTSDNPNTYTRLIRIQVSDGLSQSQAITQTLFVAPLNDPPTISGAGSTSAYVENGSPIAIATNILLEDVDNTMLSSAIVYIRPGGYQKGADRLVMDENSGGTYEWDADSGILNIFGSQPLSWYETALNWVKYENISDNPTSTDRIISFMINDGQNISMDVRQTITVQPINDAPILTADPIIISYTENDIISMTQSLTITDYDNESLQQAVIRIASGYQPQEDILNFTPTGNINHTWHADSATLTLTGADSIASWEQALDQILYKNSSEDPTVQNRSICFQIYDGAAWSAPVTRTIQIIPVNDPPILSLTDTPTYTEKTDPVPMAQSLSITDVDSNTITQMTIKIASGYTNAQDLLQISNSPNIQSAWNNFTLTLTGSRPLSDYIGLVQTLTYINTSIAPDPLTKPVIYQAWDHADASIPITQTLTIVQVNDPPELTGGNTIISITENTQAAVIENLAVFDPDSPLFTRADIRFISGYDMYQDELLFDDTFFINGTWYQETGHLRMEGLASPGSYQRFINKVQYENTSDDPDTTPRIIQLTVNDGTYESNAITSTIQVISVNDPPVVSGEAHYSYTENEQMKLKQALQIEDPDSPNMISATVTIIENYLPDEDFLSLVPIGNITGNFNDGTLTLSGQDTIGYYRTALANVIYENASNQPTDMLRTLIIRVYDGTVESQAITQTITIIPINDPPVVTLANPTIQYYEDSGLARLDPGIQVSDPDNSTLTKAIIHIIDDTYRVDEDFLSYSPTGNIQGKWKPVTGEMVLTGEASLSQYQTALANISYSNASNNPLEHYRVIKWTVADPIAKSLSVTQSMAVIPVNDPPILTGSEGKIQYQENSFQVIDNGIQISDYDSETMSSATIMIAQGFHEGDVAGGEDLLIYPETINNITSTGMQYGTNVLVLTGLDTIINYMAALRTIRYHNQKDDPHTNDRLITFSVFDGTSSSLHSERIIQLFSTNDAPILSVNTGAQVNEGQSVILSKDHLSATDPDDPDEGLFYTISDLPQHGTLYLDAIPLSTGLTLTQGDIDTSRLSYVHDGGETLNDGFTFYITDMHGAVTESQPFVISINPINDPPTITSSPPGLTGTEDILYTHTVTVSDPDDSVNGTDIVFLLQNSPPGMSISDMGVLQWIPTEGQLNSGTVTILALDGQEDGAMSASQSFSITVLPVEDPPEISAIDDLLTYGNTKAGPIPFTVVDAEGGPLTLNVYADNNQVVPSEWVLFQDKTPYQLNIDLTGMIPEMYTLTIMPAFEQYGAITTTILATDSAGLTASTTFTLLVDKVTITVDHWTHGTITPGHPAKVKKGEWIHFRITPKVGYLIGSVYIDGHPIGPKPSYTFWNVTEPHSITATFWESTVYTITCIETNGGTIEPKGVLPMTAGDQPVFHIIPEPNYVVADLLIDDVSMGPLEWYTFPPLNAVHVIKPLFQYVPAPIALFTMDTSQGTAPVTVQFEDQSKGDITQWLWDFGDGGQSSAQHPVHTYMNAGDYDVQLTVSGYGGSAHTQLDKCVTVDASKVDFVTLSQTGLAPLTVTFINQSTLSSVNSWDWDFGDSHSSSEKNPNHVYETPGRYTVKLIARVDEINSVMEKKAYIHVTGRKITGTVVDQINNTPVPEVTVELWQDDHLFMQTLTNEAGDYTLSRLPVSDGWIVSVWPHDLSQYQPVYFLNKLSLQSADRQSTRDSDLENINFKIPPAKPYGITGKVHDGGQRGITDIQVSLYSEKHNIARTVMTDENGFYTFTGLLESDDYRISAWSEFCGCEFYYYMAPGSIISDQLPVYSTRTYQAATKVPSATPPTQRIDIILDTGGTISGNVTDSMGTPLVNVWVNAWSDLFDIGNGAFTDNHGDYEIQCLRAGSDQGYVTYQVSVNPPDYPALIYNQVKEVSKATMVTTNDQNIHFVFQKGLSIQGTVVDENGYALANIPIHAWSEAHAMTAFGQTETDNDGQYTLVNLPNYSDYRVAVFPQYYPIQYYPSSHTLTDAAYVNLELEDARQINFKLTAGALIQGIVYAEKEGIPAPMDLIVNIWSESTQTGGEIAIDANGRFEMTGLRPGVCDYIISINQPPFIPAYYGATSNSDWLHSWENTTPVCPSETTVYEMILMPGYQLSGRITYDGKPVPNALIQAWSSGSGIWAETYSTSEQINANFSLQALAAGTYELTVKADGFADKRLKYIGVDDHIQGFNISLERPKNQITGTVFGLETDKRIQISAWAQSIQDGQLIHLEGDGFPLVYTLTALTPAPDYRVELWSMDYPYQVYPNGTQFNDAEDVLVDGITRNIDFTLQHASTGSISGTITPWPGIKAGDVVFVDAVSQGQGSANNARLVFDNALPKSYELKGLPPGDDYIVSVWSNAAPMMYHSETFQEEHAQTVGVPSTVDFTMIQGKQIAGTLYENDNQPVSFALIAAESKTLNVYRSSRTDKNGTYLIEGLPPASDYQVSAWIPDMPAIYYHTPEKSVMNPEHAIGVDVSTQNAPAINIYLTAGESICGFLRDASGRAVQFSWISAKSEITGAENDTFSDIHGNFCIKGLPKSVDYQLTINPALPYVNTVRSMIATGTSDLKCIVEKGFDLFGSIQDFNGMVLPDVDISVWSSSRDFHAQTISNSTGNYSFKGVPKATDMFMTALPHADQAISHYIDGPFTVNQTIEKNITLGAAIKISGTILSLTNEPIKDAWISAYAASIQTDDRTDSASDGSFAFNHLPQADDYELTIRHPDYATQTIPFVDAIQDLQIKLAPGGAITGLVQDEKGGYLSDIRIAIQSDDGSIQQSVRSDHSGKYLISGLPLTGHMYTLSAKKEGYATDVKGPHSVGAYVQFLMIADAGRIQGRITDSGLQLPPEGIKISVRLFDEMGEFVQRVSMNTNGAFEFNGLDSQGKYAIKCSVSAGLVDPVQWVGPQGQGVLLFEDANLFSVGAFVDIILIGAW